MTNPAIYHDKIIQLQAYEKKLNWFQRFFFPSKLSEALRQYNANTPNETTALAIYSALAKKSGGILNGIGKRLLSGFKRFTQDSFTQKVVKLPKLDSETWKQTVQTEEQRLAPTHVPPPAAPPPTTQAPPLTPTPSEKPVIPPIDMTRMTNSPIQQDATSKPPTKAHDEPVTLATAPKPSSAPQSPLVGRGSVESDGQLADTGPGPTLETRKTPPSSASNSPRRGPSSPVEEVRTTVKAPDLSTPQRHNSDSLLATPKSNEITSKRQDGSGTPRDNRPPTVHPSPIPKKSPQKVEAGGCCSCKITPG